MTNNDLNLLLAILGIAIGLLGIFTTILIAAFGAIAGLIDAAGALHGRGVELMSPSQPPPPPAGPWRNSS